MMVDGLFGNLFMSKPMTNDIAIIPARSGSKRIPKKNIALFKGMPMIAWTIESALQSEVFTKIVVSTDSEEIAEIARSYGAEVPFLRDQYYDDVTPVSEATLQALIQAEDYWGLSFRSVTQLMPNCPLRNAKDIIDFQNEFFSRDIDFLISCFKFGWMNPWWAFKFSETGQHNFIFPEAMKQRSQDLESLYCPTGAIWMAKSPALKLSRSFYGKDQQFFELNWVSSVDIDDESDFKLAEVLSNANF